MGEALDVRGVMISETLAAEIFGAAPQTGHGRRKFSAARFDEATFEGDAEFGEATFDGSAQFSRTTFNGHAGFGGARFEGPARFGGARFTGKTGFDQTTFHEGARFGKATFDGDTRFSQATFKGDARFSGAIFNRNTRFDNTTFDGDARFGGTTFKSEAGFGGAKFEANAEFAEAIFEGDPGFDEATFGSDAGFERASFGWGAGYSRAIFKRRARFDRAIFKGNARFRKATFKNDAQFGGTRFEGGAGFDGAAFESDAQFSEAIFGWDVWFGETTFEGSARFDAARFEAGASFNGARFEDNAQFSGARFQGNAGFHGTTFKGDVPTLGPVTVKRRLDLDGVQFTSPVRIDTEAGTLTCRRGQFSGGVRFDVRRAFIHLDDSDLSVPSLLAGPAESAISQDEIVAQPRLLSLQRANVAGLALGNVDLTDCRFAGAHNLDKLRLEAGTVFGFSPAAAGGERRQVIAEECAWRAANTRPGWNIPLRGDYGDAPEVLSPGAVAGLYRALRKGREDAKDEPGAADFYYGEMEMRRHDREKGDIDRHHSRGRISRLVLTIYWLVSGYGLRAWRSLAALAVVIAGLAMAFYLVGFTHSVSYWKSLLFAFRSTLSLTDASVNLTAWGGFFQAILRLTGPVLLFLTLLALRGRVKR